MTKKIPLPKILAKKNAKAHPFPCQIALQTREIIQATVFWHICADKAAGMVLPFPDGINRLKSDLLSDGMQEQDWETGWEYLGKYKILFERIIFKNVLVSIRSCWDWYINKLVDFVIFARENAGNIFSQKELKKLQRITFPEIMEQILIMEKACNLDFDISDETKHYMREMALVRNLGLHNQWEVDQVYLNKSSENNRWRLGEMRTFDDKELSLWHKSLIELINKSWRPVAIKYVLAPMYPPESD